MTRQQKRRRPVSETLGGIIVGFDQQILRTLPPPHELVQKGAPVRGLTGEDGGTLDVSFPADGPGTPRAVEPPSSPAGGSTATTSEVVMSGPSGTRSA